MRARLSTLICVLVAMIAAPSAALAQDMSAPSDVTRYLLDTGLLIVAGVGALIALAGLALRDVGLARTQNAPAVCLRTIGLLGITAVMFWLSGYHLLFSIESGGFLGEFKSWALLDDDPAADGYSSGAFWFLHMALAAIGAGVISSAVSERVRLGPFLFFAAVWSGLIYPIAASWVWGGGYFSSEWSFRDMGGAGALHASAGAAALAAVMVVGPRSGRYSNGPGRPVVTTALPLSAFGSALAVAAFLLVLSGLSGSFSSVEAAISIGTICVNVMLAAAGGSLFAMFLTRTVYKRTGLVSAMTGSIAGLVSISADPLSPALWQAAMIGAVGGVIVTIVPPFLDRFRIDDAGFAVPTHLICGVWGVLIAFWVNDVIWLSGQLLGVAAITGFSFAMSMLVWVALKYTIGVRSAPLEEPGFEPAMGEAEVANR